jgi:hypothetical protein
MILMSTASFPIIGHFSMNFSNGWRNRERFFQWLEKFRALFPMVGKIRHKFSNHWKTLTNASLPVEALDHEQEASARLVQFPR